MRMKRSNNGYFDWLRGLVNETAVRRADILNSIDYRWHFVLDDNRAQAGLNLREIYADEYGIRVEDTQLGPASVFEVLVALSQRFAENADISVDRAYHEIISNMKLDWDTDIQKIVEDWMDGDYDYDGAGSPFPLDAYDGDARLVDLWTQMTLYISENYPLKKDWLIS